MPSPRALLLAALALAACSSASRVDVDPGTLRFAGVGKVAKVHATPRERSGKPVPDQVCAWSSSDERVARVAGAHNGAEVTSVGPGTAVVRCTIGAVAGEVPVTVRVVSRVVVRPGRAEVKVLDEPAPLALQVEAYDDQGVAVTGRVAQVSCASEDVCRGDARGQLWAVAAGDTTALVEVEGVRSAEIPVHVVDARTAAGKPRAVRGNPMEEIERQVRARDAAERKAAEKAAAAGK